MTLAELKASRLAELSHRTQQVLARGYTYPATGVTVSLSLDAQARYLGLTQLLSLTGTVTIEASDPTLPAMALTSFLQVSPFTTAVLQYVRDTWEAHNTLASAIRACTTVAQVEGIFDTR